MAQNSLTAGRARMLRVAALCNAVAFVVVNVWIYLALIWFKRTQSHVYFEPPTISRAIRPAYIGEPFAIWISVAAALLFAGVAILSLSYVAALRAAERATGQRAPMLLALAPAVFVTQAAACCGMVTLSHYRSDNFPETHMLGSYAFFGAQALVILLYLVFNLGLLRRPALLEAFARAGAVDPAWVRRRVWLCSAALGLILAYLGLFMSKNVWSYQDAPALHLVYTLTEPAVITTFLLVLLSAHADKLPRWG